MVVTSINSMKAALLCLGSSVLAQSPGATYGDNASPVERDSEAITRNYPDIDVPLLSPAFTNPETIPEGWYQGTSQPTPDFVLGENFSIACLWMILTANRQFPADSSTTQ